MKVILRVLFVTFLSFSAFKGYASTGWCTVADGGTKQYKYDFGSMNISDSSKNQPGTVFPDAYSWDLGSYYYVICDCDGTWLNLYSHTETGLPLGHNDGGNQYYVINDYLEVATSVYIAGSRGEYVPTPWESESNEQNGNHICTSSYTASTGSKGKLSLYIKKAFVGTVSINTKVLDIYGSSVSGSFGGAPMTSLYLTGQVIVPQTCSVNAGQIVTVDFGSFMSGEFKNKGQMPTGYTPKTITVPIKCNGMDANASLTLHFQAEASTDEPAAIKTSNDDVGVQITDDSGKVIEPNSGLIPFQLDDNMQATVTFHAAPISTTGNAPAEGTFSATAYIRVDFA